MYGWRQWWGRYRAPLILVSLALAGAWFLRQTQGAMILELYQLISSPLSGNITPKDRLINARIQELETRIKEADAQNQQLRKLLNYARSAKLPAMTAQVTGRSADNWWQQLTLGKGDKDGIRVGDAVMAPGGLVGRVSTTSVNTSRVLLVSDRSSRVGAVVARSRNMGFVRGDGGNRVVMEFFDKVPNVRVGDAIVTSSVSKLFPPGLPIGRVESINLQQDPAPVAIIKLNAPISYLEWVLVHSPAQP